MIAPVTGRPGLRSLKTANHRTIFLQSGPLVMLAGGRAINGTKSRDVTNDLTDRLQPGLVMGKVTSGGLYANSIIGLTQGALTTSGTTLTTSAAIATEIVRRIGATGTFKLTGPPTAAGTVRTVTVTYSSVNTTTGDITITAAGVNEVQTVNLVTAGTAGNLRLIVPKPDGTLALTPNIAWNATDATLLSNANTALDTATGVSGGIVATAISATDTDLGMVLTFSGTGYAGLSGPTNATSGPWPLTSVHTLFTSNTGANVVRTTAGVSGAFVTNSFIQPTDGSETPLLLLPDGYTIKVTDEDGTAQDQSFPEMPIEAVVDSSQIINWPADTSLQAWLVGQLNASYGGQYVFDHKY